MCHRKLTFEIEQYVLEDGAEPKEILAVCKHFTALYPEHLALDEVYNIILHTPTIKHFMDAEGVAYVY